MSRAKLRSYYNLAVGLALLVGFVLGYSLRGKSYGTSEGGALRPHRTYERDFPGARARYLQAKASYTAGPYVKTAYGDTLALLAQAVQAQPGYLPYQALKANVYEDWAAHAERGDVNRQQLDAVAEAVGLPRGASPERLAQACREEAQRTWEQMADQPLATDVKRYGTQWRTIIGQHVGALKQLRDFQLEVSPEGYVDLTPAYNVYAITRDHDRYVSNLSRLEQGLTFEEKHMPDVLFCPAHRDVGFEFPCLRHLSAAGGSTIREDVEFCCTALAVDNQKLDLRDAKASTLHLLCFNVTLEGRPVRAAVMVEYAGGREAIQPVTIGPWRQSRDLLRDAAARAALDPAYRDTEMHEGNGQEFEMTLEPLYMYHVQVPLDSTDTVDVIGLPRHDPSAAGLEDPGIADVRIVAMTLK